MVDGALHPLPALDVGVFTCPACDRPNRHPEELAQRYCGACHWWTGDPGRAWQRPDLFVVRGRPVPRCPWLDLPAG